MRCKQPRFRVLRHAASRLLCALALAGSALASDPDPYAEFRDAETFGYDDSGDIPWIETETEVLAMPEAADLSRLRLDRLPRDFELLVDKERITVDPRDRVVRLWLWMRSSAGNESGTFEGYRCSTGEYKVYAYANPRREPPVRRAPNARWKAVSEARGGDYRTELLKDYLCGIRGTRSAHEIRQYMTGTFERERFMSE